MTDHWVARVEPVSMPPVPPTGYSTGTGSPPPSFGKCPHDSPSLVGTGVVEPRQHHPTNEAIGTEVVDGYARERPGDVEVAGTGIERWLAGH